jgi:general secretion pathway protein D
MGCGAWQRVRLVLPVLLLLAGCSGHGLDEGGASILAPEAAPAPTVDQAYPPQSGALLSDVNTGWTTKSQLFPGTGQFTGVIKEIRKSSKVSDAEPVTLNLVDVSVQQAAKAILGDIFDVNYFVDDAVKATISIQTSQPVAPSLVLDMFQTNLRAKGAMIASDNGFYRIVPADQGGASAASFRPPAAGQENLGVQVKTVSLRYVSATEMERILLPLVSKGAVLRVDTSRNMLMLQGTQKELSAMQEAVGIFDVDYMKGMSFALIPVTTSDPESMAKELDTIFANGKSGTGKGVVQFVPNSRLSAILVMTPQAQYLERAETWIKRLDHAATGAEAQLYVYHIQNRPAPELAKVLQNVFAGQAEATIAPRGTVAPKFGEAQIATPAADAPALAGGAANADAAAGQAGLAQPAQAAAFDSADASSTDTQSSTKRDKRIKIVADEANNSLLIMAVPKDYDRVLRVLNRIDAVPTQVLLEATIAEVTLNDDLKYGIRWYFEAHNSKFTWSDAANGAVAPAFPGFSYFFSLPNIQVALNALSEITDVNVISTPTLMVLDNKTATLQVGDQVPITTQTSVSTVAGGAPTVNSVQLKDTGIILKVTPRVNDSGRVVLEIEQEVSDVVKTTTSNIDSPTIQQRKIKTTVAVNDGAALALGGLVQERNTTAKDQVPVLGDVPFFGTLFKAKDNRIRRTELIIIIRPHVVRDDTEAHDVTEEFKKHINLTMKQHKKGRPGIRENIDRILR